jgi:hypothetical protein
MRMRGGKRMCLVCLPWIVFLAAMMLLVAVGWDDLNDIAKPLQVPGCGSYCLP